MFFSDHGDYTGDYSIAEKVQNCFENPISNVPLLIKPAKQFECKPRKTKALAELVDLCQTVCDIVRIRQICSIWEVSIACIGWKRFS